MFGSEDFGRVAFYVRVSTDEQADKGTIQAQLEALRRAARELGWRVVAEYVDEGWSGAKPLEERPEASRLLRDAKQGRFDTVIFYRLDRLARSLFTIMSAYNTLSGMGIRLRSLTEPFDTEEPFGKAMFQFLGIIAELERSTITERTRVGRDKWAREGRWMTGPVPFGYELDAERKLVPSAKWVEGMEMTEAELVRSIYEAIAAGSTMARECVRLNAFGVKRDVRWANGNRTVAKKTRPWGETWLPSSLWKILHNPIYKGTHVFKSKLGPIERPVPALVTPHLWDAVVQKLRDGKFCKTGRGGRQYPLTGLLRCMGCGAAMSGHRHTGNGGKGRKYPYDKAYYRCASQMGGKGCGAKILSADEIERAVWGDIMELLDHPAESLREAQTVMQEDLAKMPDLAARRQAIQRQILAKEQGVERLRDAVADGTFTKEEIRPKVDRLREEQAVLEQELLGIRTEEELTMAAEASLSRDAALLARYHEQREQLRDTADQHRRREVIQALCREIRVWTEGEGRGKVARWQARYIQSRVSAFGYTIRAYVQRQGTTAKSGHPSPSLYRGCDGTAQRVPDGADLRARR